MFFWCYRYLFQWIECSQLMWLILYFSLFHYLYIFQSTKLSQQLRKLKRRMTKEVKELTWVVFRVWCVQIDDVLKDSDKSEALASHVDQLLLACTLQLRCACTRHSEIEDGIHPDVIRLYKCLLATILSVRILYTDLQGSNRSTRLLYLFLHLKMISRSSRVTSLHLAMFVNSCNGLGKSLKE